MDAYVITIVVLIVLSVLFVVYYVKKSKEELEGKIEDLSCKINPTLQKITGEKYECVEGKEEFKQD